MGYWGRTVYVTQSAYEAVAQATESAQSLDDEASLAELQESRVEVQAALAKLNQYPALPGTKVQVRQQLEERATAQATRLNGLIEAEVANVARENEAESIFASATDAAKRAADLTQSPPHPAGVWQSSLELWDAAIEALSSISESTDIYDSAQEKLTTYNTNREAISKRLQAEKSSVEAYERAHILVEDAVVMAKQSPYGLDDLRKVETAIKEALQIFKSIPSGTTVSENAKKRIEAHTVNLEGIQTKMAEMAQCDPSTDLLDCREYQSVIIAVFSDEGEQIATTGPPTPSRAPRSGTCDCPYDRNSRGERCGDRSAYSRPGGRSPICYQ
ncbi:MAG: hypothetical protein AAFV46_01865 [Cyanobacteria bacterium J06635_11]